MRRRAADRDSVKGLILLLALILLGTVNGGMANGGGARPEAIDFELGPLDDSGLHGPPDGRRSLDYEFCIPAGAPYRDRVAAIDPSARFTPRGRGRIGCGPTQSLVIGNTHQPGFREILETLAQLPFVERISQALFE